MARRTDTAVETILEQLIGDHPGETAEIFSYAFELAMQIELKNFLGAEFYQRTSGRQVYADGYNAKRINTPAC